MIAHRLDDAVSSAAIEAVRRIVDEALSGFLSDRATELAGMDPEATVLAEEIRRLLAAGGKRIRPALCYWAHRAAGGEDPAIVRAAAALELLHTFALVHDDVMDGSAERRGAASTPARFAADAPAGVDPVAFGRSAAILVGDLAAVWSEQLLRTCGAAPGRLDAAMRRFDRMRAEMAAGQLLDVRAAGSRSARAAALKTSSYTAEGPVLIGSALAGAGPALEGPLRVYAGLVGEAFQLRDDVLDGDAPPGEARRIDVLVARATAAVEDAGLSPGGRDALTELASLLPLPDVG